MSPPTTVSQGKSARATPRKRAPAAAPPKSAAKPGTPAAASAASGELTPEQRQHYIAEAAYFRAERRGFGAGGELDDWLRAEAQLDAALNSQGTS